MKRKTHVLTVIAFAVTLFCITAVQAQFPRIGGFYPRTQTFTTVINGATIYYTITGRYRFIRFTLSICAGIVCDITEAKKISGYNQPLSVISI